MFSRGGEIVLGFYLEKQMNRHQLPFLNRLVTFRCKCTNFFHETKGKMKKIFDKMDNFSTFAEK